MLYKQIASSIANDIMSGKYQEGEKLASEIALAESFSTTKSTIRKSLKLLVTQGYIHVINQSGYYVNSFDIIRSFNALSLRSFSELHPNDKIENKVLFFDKLPAPEEIAEKLNIKPFDPVFFGIRIRIVNDVNVQMESIYLPEYLFPELTINDFSGSIFEYVEGRYKIAYAIKNIKADTIPLAFEKYLPTFAQKPLLVIEDVARLRDGRIFNYTQTYQLNHSLTVISHR